MTVHLDTYRLGNLDIFDARPVLGPDGYGKRPLSAIQTISIHHWASVPYSPNASMDTEIAAMQRVADYHRNKPEPFLGYAYHLTVFPSGRIYYTGPLDSIRYTVSGRGNIETAAIALPGNFMVNQPSAAHLAAVKAAVDELRFALGWFVPVVAHRDYGTSSCPGDTWDEWRSVFDQPAHDPRSPEEVQLDVLWALVQKMDDDDRLAGEAAINALKADLGLE